MTKILIYLLITESWLNDTISIAMLNEPSYIYSYIDGDLRINRNDTCNEIGGSLIVYCLNDVILKHDPVESINLTSFVASKC